MTTRPSQREKQHDSDGIYLRHGNFKKFRWIGDLRESGLHPRFDIIEECITHDDMCEAEKRWIRRYKSSGSASLNIAEGGTSRAPLKAYRFTIEEWEECLQLLVDAEDVLCRALKTAMEGAGAKKYKHLYKAKGLIRLGRAQIEDVVEGTYFQDDPKDGFAFVEESKMKGRSL